jgi:hypothetical protein
MTSGSCSAPSATASAPFRATRVRNPAASSTSEPHVIRAAMEASRLGTVLEPRAGTEAIAAAPREWGEVAHLQPVRP